jgi:hypothetical protein
MFEGLLVVAQVLREAHLAVLLAVERCEALRFTSSHESGGIRRR